MTNTKSNPPQEALPAVDGDLLPAIGEKVLIHLNSSDSWVEHRVVGYYVRGDLGRNTGFHRVFVRVVDSNGYPNARLLQDVRRIDAEPSALSAVSDSLCENERGPSLPERDFTRPAEAQGLFRKFNVSRVDGSDAAGGKHHGCEYFVLDVDHDVHAPAALRAYAQACKDTHPVLSQELAARFGAAPEQPIAAVQPADDLIGYIHKEDLEKLRSSAAGNHLTVGLDTRQAWPIGLNESNPYDWLVAVYARPSASAQQAAMSARIESIVKHAFGFYEDSEIQERLIDQITKAFKDATVAGVDESSSGEGA